MSNTTIVQSNLTVSQSTLSLDEWIFIGEYLKDGNATRAVRVAGYVGYFAGDEGYRLLKKPMIADEIKRVNEIKRSKLNLSPGDVIRDIVSVLNADPRDLVQLVTGSCRHCHGTEHDYHRTSGEMKTARKMWLADAWMQQQGIPFDTKGGEGFNAYRDPHPACPECYGKGVQIPRLKDTRELSPETASLFAGIRQTKYGIEYVLRSKDAAREAAAKYLGLNKETLDLTVTRKLESYTDAELLKLMNESK